MSEEFHFSELFGTIMVLSRAIFTAHKRSCSRGGGGGGVCSLFHDDSFVLKHLCMVPFDILG